MKKFPLFLFFLLALSLSACCFMARIFNPNNLPAGCSAPKASFAASQTIVQEGATVLFTDQSTGTPQSWSWTFPGGTPSASSEKNPQVAYNQAGTHAVTLTVLNNNGSNTETKSGYITVLETLNADFDATPKSVQSGSKISFIDHSTGNPTSWNWTFQGGNPPTSTSKNPQVTYSTVGTHTVKLQVKNTLNNSDTETKNGFITVTAQPQIEYIQRVTVDLEIDGDNKEEPCSFRLNLEKSGTDVFTLNTWGINENWDDHQKKSTSSSDLSNRQIPLKGSYNFTIEIDRGSNCDVEFWVTVKLTSTNGTTYTLVNRDYEDWESGNRRASYSKTLQ